MLDFIECAVVYTEIFCADIVGQRVHISLTGIHLIRNVYIFSTIHQVGNVTGPTAHIGTSLNNGTCHSLHLGVVCYIHRAKHMPEIGSIAVRQCEISDAL